ncbi:prostaglandin reductase 1-like [Anopheles aquasalis]|uniref:prostaglandin reductase 1-like n=1 Tax=Anopheles aquasalis TaxID=42839 RepID=UPI00215B5FE1|nr:prostaglandin reductase 1-like [Anopheles aquasalis]
MVVASKWIYAKAFDGLPNDANFKLEQETLPDELAENEFLVEAEYLSVDPYMRPYMERYPVGSVMIGGQVGKVTVSRNPAFPVGATVFGNFGWRTHTVVDPARYTGSNTPYVLPSFGSHPRSLALGVLGMPGNTAYFGFLEICKPQPGETVVVSGAAGAVGSVVGQIAKIKGCTVIGVAGSEAKCRWLKELGFDATIDYRAVSDFGAALKAAAPKGVDCYFDNVGGTISAAVLQQMNLYGRISVCGTISNYNERRVQVDDPQREFVFKQLRQEGFIVSRWHERWLEGITQNLRWIEEGKLRYQETTTNGFAQMPKAFVDMLTGGNTGKAVVQV